MSFRSPRPRRAAALVSVVAAVGGILALAGCTSTSPQVAPSAPASASDGPRTAPPSPAPTFDADASTPDALAEFTSVVKKRLATDPQPHGRDVIDALAAAGFDKGAMQLTPDETTIGRGVDSIEFSVLWKKKDCLIGQVGPSGFASTSAPVLSTDACLIGTTRSIDW